MREGADRAELTLGRLRIELVTAEALHHRYGDFAGDAAGRSAWMAGLALRCASLDALRLALRALPARDVHDQGSRVVVAARRATNTLLEFVE